ncbi:MAG TPA: hypothetical protein VHK05_02260, partial [Candidatus Limnocylindrales bacterium]|nr:hypothetical protein [Candidatus Limnocylindrales bacterium]
MTDRNDGISGWRPPDDGGARRPPPYAGSIGWAVLVWVATVALVYVVAQVLGLQESGGFLGLAGFLL